MNTSWLILGGAVITALCVLFLGTGDKLFKIPRYKKYENDNEKSLNWLENKLETAKSEIDIISGGFNPAVYDGFAEILKIRLAEEAKQSRSKRLHVRMLAGPTVLTVGRKNKIHELWESNPFPEALEIKFSPEEILPHFRVVDGLHIYVEDEHDLGDHTRTVETIDNGWIKAQQLSERFERIWRRVPKGIVPTLKEMVSELNVNPNVRCEGEDRANERGGHAEDLQSIKPRVFAGSTR